MSSRCLEWIVALCVLAAPALAQAEELRVCADPANLPFSDREGRGFEDRIAALVGKELKADVSFVWWNDRRATALEALNKGKCDLVPGAVAGMDEVATTSPWLRSGYAIVTRESQGPISSFDDPALRRLKIGVQSVGDDAATPPVAALLRRGITTLEPYTLHGHYDDPNSAGQMVADVASGKIGAAVLWGPFAGFFAAHQQTPLTVTLVEPGPADPPMRFSIAMATRKGDGDLSQRIDAALKARRSDIDGILDQYAVPRLQSPKETP